MQKSVYTRKYRRLIESLREARLAANLTQSDAGKALKRHQSFVSKIESGERRIDVIELVELCSLYKTSVVEILRVAE